MGGGQKSKYTIVVDNLSSQTRSSDLEYEFGRAGKIRDLIRDGKARCALIEFERGADASYAWRKMDKLWLHGRELKVDWATRGDFKFFGWKWTEGSPSPSPRGRSISRSRSRSPERGAPQTPYDNLDNQRGTANTASTSPF